MKEPTTPQDECHRLSTLRGLSILDTPAEARFDRITRLARRLFDVPIALVSLVDDNRQWFKSADGLDAPETSRAISFCGHAINSCDAMLVGDAAADLRFADNPLVTGEPKIRFYAGQPLHALNGAALGTLCVIDRRPRTFSTDDLQALADLAAIVEREINILALATQDMLTELYNRRGFELTAGQALKSARARRQSMALVVMDLDAFKDTNDQHGHAAGDEVLRRFANALTEIAGAGDIVARLGGDEFAWLLPAAEMDMAAAMTRLQELLAAQDGLAVDFSYGVEVADDNNIASLATLLDKADRQMYRHKQAFPLDLHAAS